MADASLRVLLDHRPAVYGDGGVGTYVRHLLRAYAAAFPADRLTLLQARLRRPQRVDDEGDDPAEAVLLGQRRHAWRARLGRPWDAMAKVDVVHATDFVPVRTRRVPLVATVHDVLFASHPEWYPPAMRRRLSRVVDGLVQGAARLIVPSTSSRDGLVAHFGADPARIDVVPLGAPAVPAVAPASDGTPYLLAVGRLEPRKNHARLLAAYAQSRAAREGLVLKVVGPRGWMDDPVLRAIEATPGAAWLGRVSRERLAALLRGARAVLYPSLGEGFGLPVLEALQVARPLLVGAGTSAAVLAGEAAVAVAPTSIDALRDGIDRVALDEPLRIRLMRLGPTQAAGYPWEATARATRATYLRACTA